MVKNVANIPVLLPVNRDTCDRAYISIMSVAKYCSRKIDVCFIGFDLEWAHQKKLRSLNAEKLRARIINQDVDLDLAWGGWQWFCKIPELFPDEPKVLCITPDIIACADISALWEINIGKCAIAAVPQIRNNLIRCQIEHFWGMHHKRFVNTDLMLVSTKNFLLRRKHLLTTLYRYPQFASSKAAIINLAFEKSIFPLAVEWNCPFEPEFWNSRNEFLVEEDKNRYESGKRNPYFLNYGGIHKPWNYPGMKESQYYLKAHDDRKGMDSNTFLITVIFCIVCEKNRERLLRQHVERILSQPTDLLRKIQIVIVYYGFGNDTEKDRGEYTKRHPENIIYDFLHGDGIQKARNRAIELAEGDFLLFLDDDCYPEDHFFVSVEKRLEKLEQEIDVLGIPFRYIESDKETRLRQKFGEEAFCKLNQYTDYGIGVNYIFAFLFRRHTNLYFDENLAARASEIKYVIANLERNRTIGWVNETQIFVRGKGEKTVDYIRNKEILAGHFFDFWKILLDHYKEEKGFIPHLLQYSYMEEVIIFESEIMDCTEDKENNTAPDDFWEAVRPALKQIDDLVIIDSLGMHDMSRILLIMEKKYGIGPQFGKIENDIEIFFGKTVVGRLSYQSVLLHFIEIHHDRLQIQGESSVPSCLGRKAAKVWVEVNGVRHSTDFIERETVKTFLGESYETGMTFVFQYPLRDSSKIRFRFLMQVEDQWIAYHAVIGLRFSPVSNEIKSAYAMRDGYALWIEKDSLYCKRADDFFQHDREIRYRKELKESGNKDAVRAVRFRRWLCEARKRKKKPIWLFFDRIDKADDNGEALFRYICGRNLGIQTYFVIGKGNADYDRLRKIGNVVQANSIKHQFLFVLADYILTSQVNGFVENPFGSAEKYYRDILHTPKVIFLQHGITKDDQTRWLNRFNQDLYAIVTSCKRETDSILSSAYYYGPKQVWMTGMPRFDRLYHDERKYLLIMPTWRRQYMEQHWCEEQKVFRWEPLNDFTISDYCKAYHSLVSNERLAAVCGRYGYQLVFMPHPIVRPWLDDFHIPDVVMTMPYDTSWRDLFAWSDLMVTDYSSVAFDFAYLQKPLIYYQFDRDAFFRNHTYRQGYFDYEKDGFGEIVEEENRLVELLEEYMKNNCRLKDCYRERIISFYEYQDQNNCGRLLEKILQGEQEE